MSWADAIERQATSCALCLRGSLDVLGLMPTRHGLVCNVCVEGLVDAGLARIASRRSEREMEGRIAA